MSDISTIESHINSDENITTNNRILEGSASPMEIKQWSLRQDPLDQTFFQELMRAMGPFGVSKIFKKRLDEVWIKEKASTILLNSAGIDTSGESELEARQRRVSDGSLSKDDIDSLIISEELLHQSLDHLRTIISLPQVTSLIIDPDPRYKNLEERIRIDESKIIRIDHYLLDRLLDPNISDERLQILGLEKLFQMAGTISYDYDSPTLSTERKERLLTMVNELERVFLQNKVLSEPSLPKSDIKGLLHELIWVLDARLFLLMSGDDKTTVLPTMTFQDMPKIGKPQEKRGADILIENPSNLTQFYVQLKSSPNQNHKPYHPFIYRAEEQNFQDTNPGRLAKKIKLYRDYIKSGFDSNKTAEVMRYILPSVIELFTSDLHAYNIVEHLKKKGTIER